MLKIILAHKFKLDDVVCSTLLLNTAICLNILDIKQENRK